MRNDWFFSMDLDGTSPFIFLPVESLVSHGFGIQKISHISSVIDDSLYHSRALSAQGSMALQGAFSCISKFTSAILLWLSSGSGTHMSKKIARNLHGSKVGSYKTSARAGYHLDSSSKDARTVIFSKISSFTMKYFFRESERLQSFPMLSLIAALVPPFDNISLEVLGNPLVNNDIEMHEYMNYRPCEVGYQGCAGSFFPDMDWTKHVAEPKTGIEFPMILSDNFSRKDNSNLTSEVLVGTGSRTVKVIKFKTMKIFAFGVYVHPDSVCEKLGPKYASIPVGELKERHEFYQDLLREDIHMTVRLVVNCNGMKIDTVKSAFEKSLRARLVKTNPDTDYHCLSSFGSCFTQDIPLPVGTTIDFRRTADGQLITEIEGNQIGAVRSKDLCRAFFDMYIGDVPLSEQTKEEIGKNVANMMKRC